MGSYKLQEIADLIGGEIIGNRVTEIEEIYFDSRRIYQPKNGIFFDFGGKNHSYIDDAYKKGIRVFVTQNIQNHREDAVYLKVDSPLQALQIWAKKHREKFNLPVVGITGSNGKTIVKEWLNQLLWKDFTIVRSPKSYNSQIGVPLSVLRIHEKDNLGIFEAGISLPNEMRVLEEIIQPEIGVLTHIGSAHLENFNSSKELINEKLKLFKNCRKIVFNSDNEEVKRLILEKYSDRELITFGRKRENTLQFLEAKDTQNGKDIRFLYKSVEYNLSIPFHDEASVENILTVFAALAALQIPFEKYIDACNELLPIEMRLEIKEAVRNSILINDAFNSDLHSVKVALDVLAQQPFPRKSLVLTDVLQSQLKEEELYQEVANLVNGYAIDDLILIGEKISKYKTLFKTPARVYQTTQDFLKVINLQNVNNEAILLKGARPFALEKISAFLEKKSHDTVLEVNLQALIDNVNFFRSRLKPQTKIMGMIKANAYGHGSFEIAHTLEHQKIDYLGAAYADEGVELRRQGITLPIVVMNPEQSSYSSIIDFKLEPELYSLRVLNLFVQILREKSVTEVYPVHIKIDTGMNRLGFKTDQLEDLISFLKENQTLKVQSIFTHLATADVPEEKEFALLQLKRFDESYEKISTALNIRPLKHALNSPGTIHFQENQYDMIRLGIGMYGFSDSPAVQEKLKPIATFKTVISRIIEINPGETVSYGRKFKAEKKTKIATLPVGYADGIRRAFGYGKGKVNISGHLVPIIGTVCMDMLMIDITGIDCFEGDEVIIFGENPTAEDLAKTIDTISYEVLTSISSRVKRVYYKE